MLKRPSTRRKSHLGGFELNLVPILDTLVTLIGFLLFTTTFFPLVHIESPLPIKTPPEKKASSLDPPLQLTVTLRDQDVEIWSPFSKITPQSIANLDKGHPNTDAIHKAVIQIKKLFPSEKTVILVPLPSTSYDYLIGLMDALRTIEPTDPPLPGKELFPKIVFGNLLGDV